MNPHNNIKIFVFRKTFSAALAAGVLAGLVLTGCQGSSGFKAAPVAGKQDVPHPLNLLLPRSIRIHPFTGTREFDQGLLGGIKGIDVRIEAVDAYDDATKAFGDFRFELYEYRANSPDPKGGLISTWQVPLLDVKDNLLHWDNITRTYEFKLQWDRPIPVGQKFVLVAVYSSPFTQRLFAERVFISGQ